MCSYIVQRLTLVSTSTASKVHSPNFYHQSFLLDGTLHLLAQCTALNITELAAEMSKAIIIAICASMSQEAVQFIIMFALIIIIVLVVTLLQSYTVQKYVS